MDIVQAYLDITEKYGPSEQLLAFIDYDNTLPYELGLESFNSLSLQTRHEVLNSKLKHIGTEGLWGSLGSLFSKAEKEKEALKSKTLDPARFGELETSDIIHKGVVLKEGKKKARFEDYEVFLYFFSSCEHNFRISALWLSDIPSDFSESSWKRFVDTNDAHIEKVFSDESQYIENVNRDIEKHHHDKTGHDLSSGGWTTDRFVAGVKSWVSIIEREKDLISKAEPKIGKIKHWMETEGQHPDNMEVVKLITHHVDLSGKVSALEDNMMREVKEILDDISHYLEIKH